MNQSCEFHGKPGGFVSAFALNPEASDLRLLNSSFTRGADPCYLTGDSTGRFVVVANHSGDNLAVLPEGSTLYVVNELDSTLKLLIVDRSTGGLEHRQTLSSLPSDFAGQNFPADVHVAPSGRLVYGSNRGHNSIAVFAVDTKSGKVSPVQHESTGGEWPRNCAIDLTGQYLLVANQRSDLTAVFTVRGESGTLAPTGQAVEVPSPVCLKFL